MAIEEVYLEEISRELRGLKKEIEDVKDDLKTDEILDQLERLEERIRKVESELQRMNETLDYIEAKL